MRRSTARGPSNGAVRQLDLAAVHDAAAYRRPCSSTAWRPGLGRNFPKYLDSELHIRHWDDGQGYLGFGNERGPGKIKMGSGARYIAPVTGRRRTGERDISVITFSTVYTRC